MFNRINNWLTYPSIILSAMTSIGIAGFDCMEQTRYVLSAMTLMSAILTGINQHFQAAEKSQEFLLRAKDYYAVIRDIEYILATDKQDRAPPKDVIITLRNTLDKIIDQQIDFPLRVVREYEKKFRSVESVFFPDLQQQTTNGMYMNVGSPTVNNPENDTQSDEMTMTKTEVGMLRKSMSKATIMNQSPTINYTSRTSGSFINDIMQRRRKLRNKTSATIIAPYQLYNNEIITKTIAENASPRTVSISFASPLQNTNGNLGLSSLYKSSSFKGLSQVPSIFGRQGTQQLPINTQTSIMSQNTNTVGTTTIPVVQPQSAICNIEDFEKENGERSSQGTQKGNGTRIVSVFASPTFTIPISSSNLPSQQQSQSQTVIDIPASTSITQNAPSSSPTVRFQDRPQSSTDVSMRNKA